MQVLTKILAASLAQSWKSRCPFSGKNAINAN